MYTYIVYSDSVYVKVFLSEKYERGYTTLYENTTIHQTCYWTKKSSPYRIPLYQVSYRL